MRYIIGSLMALAMAFNAVAPAATVLAATIEEQQVIVERLSGSFVLATEDNGRLWYVLPTTGFRVLLSDKNALFLFAQDHAIVIGKSELTLLPTKKQALTSSAKKAIAARKGSFVTTSASLANMWYVNPKDGLRYDMATADKAWAVATKIALGVSNADLNLVPVDPTMAAPVIVEPAPAPTPAPETKPVAPKTVKAKKGAYKNGQIGWDFASGLWTGYEQYHRAFNDWPDIKWFNNVVSYNLPIYLNETGFSLDSGKQNFFVWDDFSTQWKDMYKNHFSWKRTGDLVVMKFDLASDVTTAQHGVLKAGTYYFTNKEGLLSEKEYKIADGTYEMTDQERIADTKRVFTQALAIAAALDKYNQAVMAYPITYEAPIELGMNGLTGLCLEGGFSCYSPNTSNTVFISNIASGRPSTRFIYDSRYGGKSYALTFTVYGSYDQYGPGVYEISPYNVKKIADITDNLIKR